MSKRTGGCFCKAVRFAIGAELRDVGFCHCSVCRRMNGSAFGAYCEVPNTELDWLCGTEKLTTYLATERLEKLFCSICGAGLLTRHSGFPGFSYVSLGVLDDDSGIKAEYHQFVASRARWHDIADGLPRFDEWPEEASPKP